MRRTNESPRPRRGERGFTLIEMICVISIITIIAALAIGHYNQAIVAANERAAVAALRVVSESETNYRFSGGDAQGYAHLGRLAELGMIDKLLGGDDGASATGQRSGYYFQSTLIPRVGEAQPGYIISAVPRHTNSLTGTGTRRYAVDDSGVLYSDTNELDTHYTTKESLTAGTSAVFKP
jgi:prepilin-type N-terminal cleavage/methylation domain-containing protein